MPRYCIRVVNRDFETSSDHELSTMDAAKSEGLKGALQIGIQEICEGKMFFAAEIRVENEHEPSQRMMVAVGASPLQ
jgi:hypothetical protein